MRKIKLLISASFDGKIADSNGQLDWLYELHIPEPTDTIFIDFYNSVDTTIMGYNSFQHITQTGRSDIFPDKENFVLTRKTNLPAHKDVEFVTKNHVEFIRQLKTKSGKDIWLIGGGIINKELLNEKLVDEISVSLMPILLGKGINLFAEELNTIKLKLIESRTFESGAIAITYSVVNE